MGEEAPSVSGTNCKFAVGADQREWRRRSAPFALLTSLTPTSRETTLTLSPPHGDCVLVSPFGEGFQASAAEKSPRKANSFIFVFFSNKLLIILLKFVTINFSKENVMTNLENVLLL